MAAKPSRRNHPETLHYLARVLVGVREADRARATGGMHYDLLIQRVKDVLEAGLPRVKEANSDDH